MEDTGALADLVAREEPLEAVEEARPQGRDAREPEPRVRLERPAHGLGGAGEATHRARVARAAGVPVPLDEVDAADLGIRLAIALEVEHELEDVARRSTDERCRLGGEHARTQRAVATVNPAVRPRRRSLRRSTNAARRTMANGQ